MREMKDSGIEWIGEIPKDWIITKIKNHFKIGSGTTPTSNDPELWNGDIVWITPADFKTDDVYVEKGHRYLSEKGFTSSSLELIEPGNIIFSKRAPIGQVVINRTRLCTNQGCLTVVKTDKSDVRYYRYVMSVATEEFELSGSGTTFKEISANTFGNTFLPRPSYYVQKSIADYLDERCAKIDAIIEKQQEIIEKLKEYKLSIISETVTKGLNPDVEMKDSGIEWIGVIPKSWNVVFLSALFNEHKIKNKGLVEDNLLSLSYGKIKKKDIRSNEGLLPESFENYNIVYPGNIVFRLTDLQNDKKSLRTGLCTEKGIITSAYITIELEQDDLPKYMYYLFHSYDIYKVFYGMGDGVRQSMTYKDLKGLLVLRPSVEEQIEIAEYLDDICNKIEYKITQKEEIIKKFKEYKISLIYEVVTGKKEV